MKPLIREGVVWFQKQITGEGNPSSPHVCEKYQFFFQCSEFNIYLLCFRKQISIILKGYYFSHFPVLSFEPLEGFQFSKQKMKCVFLYPVRLMNNLMNRNTSSGWHFSVFIFFYFTLSVYCKNQDLREQERAVLAPLDFKLISPLSVLLSLQMRWMVAQSWAYSTYGTRIFPRTAFLLDWFRW